MPLIWVPLLAALFLAIVLYVLHLWHDSKQKDSVRNYRARFIQMVAQLDAVVVVVNNLGNHAARIRDQYGQLSADSAGSGRVLTIALSNLVGGRGANWRGWTSAAGATRWT